MPRHISMRLLYVAVVSLLLACPLLAKDKSKDNLETVDWPATGTPVVRFTFAKFKALPGMGSLHGYVMDTTAENLSSKPIPSAQFNVYLFDKDKARVGQDVITLTNVGPGETVKFQTTVMAAGTPESLSISAVKDASQGPKAVTLTINSTPQGAMLKVDGVEQGTTPRLIRVGVGDHTLTFSQEGFTTGTFPLQIGPNDVSGGTVNYQLGAAAFDSVELRDGSVLNGDVVSISGMDVQVRVGGVIQHLDRNAVKRIIFTQRATPEATPPLPAAAPAQPSQ
jgi:hypothetical protein